MHPSQPQRRIRDLEAQVFCGLLSSSGFLSGCAKPGGFCRQKAGLLTSSSAECVSECKAGSTRDGVGASLWMLLRGKTTQFGNKGDALHSRENKPWIETPPCLTGGGILFPRDVVVFLCVNFPVYC